jgi:hypothetical protein
MLRTIMNGDLSTALLITIGSSKHNLLEKHLCEVKLRLFSSRAEKVHLHVTGREIGKQLWAPRVMSRKD